MNHDGMGLRHFARVGSAQRVLVRDTQFAGPDGVKRRTARYGSADLASRSKFRLSPFGRFDSAASGNLTVGSLGRPARTRAQSSESSSPRPDRKYGISSGFHRNCMYPMEFPQHKQRKCSIRRWRLDTNNSISDNVQAQIKPNTMKAYSNP